MKHHITALQLYMCLFVFICSKLLVKYVAVWLLEKRIDHIEKVTR